MLRAFFYGVKSGIGDLARMPYLVLALALTITVATFLMLLSPVVEYGVNAGGVQVIQGSEVIVYMATGLDPETAALAFEELEAIPGVEHVREATSADIASTETGYEVGSDMSHVRTVVLDGTEPQRDVIADAWRVLGVDKVDAGVGDRTGLTVEVLGTVVPWLTALFGLAGLILVVNIVVAAARSRQGEAQIMRLVGASWFTVWAYLCSVVVIPVIASMLITTGVVWMASSKLLTFLSPDSVQLSTGSSVLGVGLRSTAVALMIVVGASQVGLLASRR